MLEGRTNFAAIEFENKIFWAGGYSGTTNDITCTLEMVEVLRWNSTIQKLHMPSSWKEGTGQHAVVKDRKILFFRTQGYATNKFDIYDIDSKTWSIGVLSRGLDGASIISVNNTIYIAGGYLDGTLTTSVWKVDF